MDNDKKHLFDDPKNVKYVLWFLYVSCALLLVLDFVIHRHVVHQWENLWGFYPIYGFVGCSILVFVATWMRSFLMRSEDYYDINVAVATDSDKTNINKNELEQNTKLGGHDVDA